MGAYIRWLNEDDHELGFLNLISIEPLKQFHVPMDSSTGPIDPYRLNPFKNKEEFDEIYQVIANRRKSELKIIVAEVDRKLYYSACLLTE